MQHANDLLNSTKLSRNESGAYQNPQAEGSRSTPNGNSHSSEPLLSRAVIIHLWTIMTRLYGHRWTSSFGDEVDPGNVWAAALRGLTMDGIKAGLGALVDSEYDWPPSAIEFRKLCKNRTAEALGIDDVATAYRKLCRWLDNPKRCPSDLHPAVWHVYNAVGYYNWMHMNTDDHRKTFAREYSSAIEQMQAGVVFEQPEPLKRETLIERAAPTPERQAENMAKLKGVLGGLMQTVDSGDQVALDDIAAAQRTANFFRERGINPNCVNRGGA